MPTLHCKLKQKKFKHQGKIIGCSELYDIIIKST
jgi:hypothetical protein